MQREASERLQTHAHTTRTGSHDQSSVQLTDRYSKHADTPRCCLMDHGQCHANNPSAPVDRAEPRHAAGFPGRPAPDKYTATSPARSCPLRSLPPPSGCLLAEEFKCHQPRKCDLCAAAVACAGGSLTTTHQVMPGWAHAAVWAEGISWRDVLCISPSVSSVCVFERRRPCVFELLTIDCDMCSRSPQRHLHSLS
jgi:hypothetical protein